MSFQTKVLPVFCYQNPGLKLNKSRSDRHTNKSFDFLIVSSKIGIDKETQSLKISKNVSLKLLNFPAKNNLKTFEIFIKSHFNF